MAARTMTRRQLAAFAGVHLNTVRLWEREGKIEPHTADGPNGVTIVYSTAEVTKFLAQRGHVKPRASAREHLARVQVENGVLREQLAYERTRSERLERELAKIARG